MKKKLPLLLSMLYFSVLSVFGQVTTSSLSGLVADQKGEGLPGATVTATHTSSGTKYVTTTRVDGRYIISNARVGGPYRLEVSFVGYANEKIEGIILQLGQRFDQSFQLKDASNTLAEVVIKASDVMNSNRTGASTTIGNEKLRALPTITRSTDDYVRLNPMASEGGSFGGRNSQFNNYSLDGAIFNNPFGLDAAKPGGQSDAQPVSLDAIEQISVQLAPYDVTLAGFTGATVNAVTKSGTNDFKGTFFGFTRNQNLVSNKVGDVELTKLDLSQNQYGFALGGPIVKNKVFFFVNAEFDRRSDVGSPFVPAASGRSGANVSRVAQADLELVSKLLKDTYGYETGAYENFSLKTQNQKAIAKLDFNLSDNHNLSVTYNYLDAFKEKPAHPSAIGRRGPDFLTQQFQNSGYRINNVIHGVTADLKSRFGNKASNKFQIGYTAFRDSRNPFSAPFPVLNIGKDGIRYIVAGHEPFSINNVLDQDVFQITDNLNIYKGKHTFTVGASLEKFMFNNSFNLTGYGGRVFAPDVPMSDIASVIKSADFAKEVADAKAADKTANWALAETNVGQFAIYGQDEFAISDKLVLTYGLRIDMPLYFDTKDKINENIARNCCYDPSIEYFDEAGNSVKFDHTVLPKQTPLVSPRVGFNYDVKGDKTQQLRGGTGLFTGRFPFVWVGNQVANPNFFFYNITAPDFKFPQVWRTNLGYDHRLSNGWIASADVIFTKDVNAMMVRNYGLKLPKGTLAGGGDTRKIYLPADRATVFGGATNAYVFTNTNLGYSLNTSVSLEKSFEDGFYAKVAYNFTDARDAASIAAEISSDAYDRNPGNLAHTNTPILAPSLYGNRQRVMAVGTKKFTYGKMATTVSLFGEYVQGGRFSYTYAGDINNDGSGLNDLIYIPTEAQVGQIAFTGDAAAQAAQRSAFNSYIKADDYLAANRGKYAEKYASLAPWYSNWDMRILQDFNLKNAHSIQLSADILNVGNLLNSNWGVRQWSGETGLAQPVAVSVANGVPTYSFDKNQTSAIQTRFDLVSRWRMQFGIRYSF
jgi:Carboxypeptidase regulatory-like domain